MLKTWCIIFIRPFFKLGIFNTRLDHIKTKPLILLDKIELISFRLTDSTKINRQGHSIRMYWTKVSQPTVHVRQNNFETALIEACSPDLYASFGTFCAQIGQLFAAQWVFKYSEEFRNRRHFPSKTVNCRFSNILQRLIVPATIDQFCLKMCQKKRKDLDYKLL